MSYKRARFCEVLKEWRIPIVNRYLVKYNDIAKGDNTFYELHKSPIEELQGLCHLDYSYVMHTTSKGYIVSSVYRSMIDIPHVIIFRNIDDYEHWIDGIIISLISNNRIVIPLFDGKLDSDILNDVVDMLGSDDERDCYASLIKEWNEMFKELHVSERRSMPDYNLFRMGSMHYRIAPPGELMIHI